ncbi:MAG: phospholipid carrier-dependent glycosyltransferase [Candidatus Omnitrophica bacterium]|nr:phospholipid carrier-dependent glycosyltransferase [Candidatus Omnitrophota bacterium]
MNGELRGKKRESRRIFLVSFLIFGLAAGGALVLYHATSNWGMGTNFDSAAYLAMARSLLQGRGMDIPYAAGGAQAHYAPLYPVLISFLGSSGVPLLTAARWLHLFFFALNIFLTGWILVKTTRSFWLPVLGSFFILTSADMIHIHHAVFSEPLFLFCGFLGLFLMSEYSLNGRLFLLIFSSVALAMAFLSRYAGFAFILTALVGLSFIQWRTERQRFQEVAFCFGITLLPMVLWCVRNYFIAGTWTNRLLRFHLISPEVIRQGLDTISRWCLPGNVPLAVRGGVMGIVSLGCLIYWITHRSKLPRDDFSGGGGQGLTCGHPFPLWLLVFIVTDVIFMTICISSVNESIPLNGRILSPVYMAFLFLALYAGHQFWMLSWGKVFSRIVLVCLCLWFVGFYAVRGAVTEVRLFQKGWGMTSRSWRKSPVIREVKRLPPGWIIYSNAPEAISILTVMAARFIPSKMDPFNFAPNTRWEQEMKTMVHTLEQQEGVLVFCNKRIMREWSMTQEELLEMKPVRRLKIWKSVRDGFVLKSG